MKNKLYLLIAFFAVVVYSCELPDNVDPKKAQAVAPQTVFTSALVSLDSLVAMINVNNNISRLLAQYQSQVTYPMESRYNFSDRQIPDNYSLILYRDVLMNLKDARNMIEAINVPVASDVARKKNQLGIITVCEAYTYQLLVDAFGNVPYTEACMGAQNSTPKYDDAYTIYKDLITKLSSAIDDFNAEYDGFGSADVLYDGDVALWKKFASSLKLRMGMRLSDVPGFDAGTVISEAIASGIFTDQAESAILHWTGVTPLISSYYYEYVMVNRADFSPSSTIIDKMNVLNDPRREVWFTLYNGQYVGVQYGKTAATSYSRSSHFSDNLLENPTWPVNMLDYVEIEFLLAEAAERGLGGVTDAEGHYETAILESMDYWGIPAEDAEAYYEQSSVTYATAAGDFKEKIGTQKWIALFDRGDEAWAEWRRLDYPLLNPPVGMTYEDIPLRMPYPYNENKMNLENYNAAAAAIGGDEASTRIFWDRF